MASAPASQRTARVQPAHSCVNILVDGRRPNNFGIFSELLHDSQRRLAARSAPEAPLLIRIAHHRLPDKVTMPQFQFAEEYARIFQRSVTMTTSLSKSEFRSPVSHRSFDGLIILSYAVFSILALGAIYFAMPGAPTDASLAIAMALP
jgi:hypothetical protein